MANEQSSSESSDESGIQVPNNSRARRSVVVAALCVVATVASAPIFLSVQADRVDRLAAMDDLGKTAAEEFVETALAELLPADTNWLSSHRSTSRDVDYDVAYVAAPDIVGGAMVRLSTLANAERSIHYSLEDAGYEGAAHGWVFPAGTRRADASVVNDATASDATPAVGIMSAMYPPGILVASSGYTGASASRVPAIASPVVVDERKTITSPRGGARYSDEGAVVTLTRELLASTAPVQSAPSHEPVGVPAALHPRRGHDRIDPIVHVALETTPTNPSTNAPPRLATSTLPVISAQQIAPLQVLPEPTSLALLALGVVGIGLSLRKR